ncbi:thioredoxin domain-containing protein [Rariglobus hedericola]|uniref:Thioredoxin domain-containing protein n=1 Tax=Rariglobus hedericola TaxID=2597822 RepID=A0A556QJM2_9BACT|nr:thioredoxin domain-containing protein [Rariglobus hedericola]TSJ76811.1 thioredoxin domain-containing protein [Rariglobus hedericola]
MPNALAAEKSPYLLQHADNPVNWLPWGEAAFAKARSEQKPIFLSIGYSTCHWCHVMAHESFENEAIASLLNEHFISIKVDREERPDVDKVYMSYVQAMTGHGGWPLSAWLTPDLKPFYGGTYFPPEDRHGRSGFPSVLSAIAKAWGDDRERLVAESVRVIASLTEYHESRRSEAGAAPDLHDAGGEAFEKGYQYFYENFDASNGGFGGAPKFPRASNLGFLLRAAVIQGLESDAGREAVQMVGATLQKMAGGGLHDHVGGGFHRYSVDEAWFVPHFEKMLYDQAQIAVNALDTHLATGDERFAWIVRDIFSYALRDLAAPAGGFYSAEDADSLLTHGEPEHAEGAFYVWTHAELEAALNAEDAALVCAHFGVVAGGNVSAQLDPHGEFTGKNILMQRRPLGVTAQELGLAPEVAAERLGAALEVLRGVREKRPRPHLDDKIITAWNGLMISALARAAVSTAGCLADVRDGYRAAAVRAAEFIERELYDAKRGVLYRNFRDGRGTNEAFAEDYAYLVAGLLDLYEATFDARWLRWADGLQQVMDALFWDAEHGGYFNSRADDASIVLRLKEDYDGAEPSPNSVAAANLLRLSAMFHDDGLRERALATIEALRPQWSKAAHALPELLCAIERALEMPRQVVLAGDPATTGFQALVVELHAKPGPRRAVLASPGTDEVGRWLAGRAPWLADMKPAADGRTRAYLCERFTCQAPVNTPEALRGLLG